MRAAPDGGRGAVTHCTIWAMAKAKRRDRGVPHRSGGPFGVWITDGHEAEAREEELEKPPNRIGTFMLRILGFRGKVPEAKSPPATHHPSHEHAVERPTEP